MRTRHLALAALVLAMSCDQQSKTPSASGTAEPAKPAPSTGPRQGGYIVMPSLEPTYLNPVLEATFDQVTPLVFEGLVGIDAKLEPVQRLAEKWTISADGKEIVFQLRKDVKWHDGKPFGAADVKFTMDQILDTRVPTNWRGYLQSIEKVETPDESTVRVVYKEPYGPALASFTFGIMPKHAYEGQNFLEAGANTAPIGTGPFKFVRWTPGRSIQLDANTAWWNGRPYLDRVEVVFDAPSAKALEMLTSGKLDFTLVTNPNDWTGQLSTPEFRESYETASVDEAAFFVIAWNCKKGPTKDKRVRVAIAHALDRARVIQDVLGGSGAPISGPFPAAMWGADPSIGPWPFDLATAGRLLDEAALKPTAKGNRFALEVIALEARRAPPFDEMMAIFRHDLEAVGIELKVTYLPPAAFVKRLTARDFDGAFYEWVPDIADPDPWVLLHSSQAEVGANYAGYSNPELDKLLSDAHRSTDRSVRRKGFAAVHKLVHDEQPYTFLYSPKEHYAWRRRLHGVNPIDVGPLPRFPGFAKWWVE